MSTQTLLRERPALSHTGAHWATGPDLGVLADVFDETVTIAIMQRQLDSAMRASIAAQCAAQPWQLSWRGAPDATLEQALIRSMPAAQQADALVSAGRGDGVPV